MKFSFEAFWNIREIIRHLSAGMDKLSFTDNFQAFEITSILASGTELQVRNRLKFVPSKFIITDKLGNGNISRSTTEWTRDYIYLFNHGPDEVTFTAIVMR